jgi:Arc/MetJ family transcription regulator
MATNLALDDEIIEKAKKLGGFKTKKAAVMAALEEYVRKYEQQEVMDLFGTIDFDEEYDYKKSRKRKGT